MCELDQGRTDLTAELAEQRRELEVSENDKAVLREALKLAEDERNGLALDLADTAKVGTGSVQGSRGAVGTALRWAAWKWIWIVDNL